MEEALYDSQAMRKFVGIDLGREAVPDETTVCKFRHLLERHGMAQIIFQSVQTHLQHHGLRLSMDTIVDACIIHAPSSTKNSTGTRDPKMHQTRKGRQWHFGIKMHIGVDASLGLLHTVVGRPANVHDVTQAHKLLHGNEDEVFVDSGYRRAHKRQEVIYSISTARWNVAMVPGKRKALDKTNLQGKLADELETAKARIHSNVQPPFLVIKQQLGHGEVCYRGLAKSAAQFTTLFALANLWAVRRRLLT